MSRWSILKFSLPIGIVLLLAGLQIGPIRPGHAEPARPVIKRFKAPERTPADMERITSVGQDHLPKETSQQHAPGADTPYLAKSLAQGKAEKKAETIPSTPPGSPPTAVPVVLSSALKEGILQYKEENFEEAVEILEAERRRRPESSVAAFFLGMAYKQIMNYSKALENLQDAANLSPRIKEAVIELVDVTMVLEDYDKAEEWLNVAEELAIAPSKTAFLKGELYSRKSQCEEAERAFEQAQSQDPSYKQAAELKIALCYLKAQKFKEAEERLKTSILLDPQSDMAEFARNYQDVVRARIELERPLHATLGFFGQHNSNLLTTPKDAAFRTSEDPVNSNALITSLRLNYTPRLKGPWLLSGQLSASGALNDKHSTSRDSASASISAVPGYNFGRFTLNLVTSYDYSLLRDPGYDDYLQAYGVGPLVRMSLGQRHILEFFTGFTDTDYLQAPTQPEEDRDAQALSAYLNWIWLFADNSLINLRYEFIKEETDGLWWSNIGHRISGSVTFPLIDGLNLQFSGDAFFQDFKNHHSVFLSNQETRRNETYTASVGVFYNITRKTRLVGQYTYNRAYSNIGYYDYDQHLYMAGVEFNY